MTTFHDFIPAVKATFPRIRSEHMLRFWANLASSEAGDPAALLADIKARRAAHAAADRALRAALRDHYGAGKYRITLTDEVHVYGRMPNSNVVGWWLLAQDRREAATRIGVDA